METTNGPDKFTNSWGAALHRGSIIASHLAAPGSILGIPKNNSLYVAEIY